MSFLAPMGLLLGLLALPLVALYFLRLRRRRVRVSSLMLWHAARRSEQLASPFQRFRRHLLLFVQLLALLLLVLAFARPFVATEAQQARSVVLLLDTSASMGAHDVEPSRFVSAQQQARALLDALGPADEAMIVTAGASTQVLAPFTRDKGALRHALAQATVTQAAGSLEEGLRMALSLTRTRAGVEVVVLSDGGPDDLATVPGAGADVRYLKVGREARNAGILALDLRRSPVDDHTRQLFLTVGAFGGTGPATVEVSLDGRPIGRRTATLAPGAPEAMVFDLPAGAEGSVHARLTFPGDVLAADDEAWAVATRRAAHDVLLVGGDTLLARILARDPRIDARRVPAAAVTAEQLAAADAVIFAGAVPDVPLDGLDYAVLGPSHGGPVGFGARVEAPRVVGWRRTHPLLRYTQWDRLVIGASRQVPDPAGLVPVVDGDGGPLVLAGERAGGRVVQLAFDPMTSDLPLRVAWPVFVMNTVGWLTEGEAEASRAGVPTGSALVRRLPEGVSTVSVSGPGAPQARVDDGVVRVTGLDAVGVYTLDGGRWRETFAANLADAAESDVAPREGLVLGDTDAPVRAGLATGRRELWRPLLWFALVVLLIEWGLYHRRASA